MIRILAEVDVVGGLSYLIDPNLAKPPKEKWDSGALDHGCESGRRVERRTNPMKGVIVEGMRDKIEGKLKEAEGKLTDDELREKQGQAQQKVGEGKEQLEDAKDEARERI